MLAAAFTAPLAASAPHSAVPTALLPSQEVAPLRLARTAGLEPDANTSVNSSAFLGPVLSTNCVVDTSVVNGTSWVVDNLPGGGHPRCYTAVAPQQPARKLPVVLWLTGIGGGNGRCGPCCDDANNVSSFGDLAANSDKTGGFALVCPEPLRFKGDSDPNGVWHSEMWDIPQPISDS
eukprot:7052027-Prymnesium_polylepis.1